MNVEPLASRRTTVTDETTELRQQCPSWALAVVEAVAGGRGVARPEMVNAILSDWARRQVHSANRVIAVLKGQSAPLDSDGDTLA
jgi:hypothetical protein